MAAPAMAVSQVEALKKPCRVWMWKILVAAQPPPSAPAMPMRQVRIRPCCLLPGISMLAIRPAPRPRTIQAMMPMTGSLVSDVRGVAHELVESAVRTGRDWRQASAQGAQVPGRLPGLVVAGVTWPGSARRGLAPVAAHDPPQLGDAGGARGGPDEGA